MKTLLKSLNFLSRLYDSVDTAMGHKSLSNKRAVPRTQLQEHGNGLIISVPVPGLRKEDLMVHIDGNLLIVSTTNQIRFSEAAGMSDRSFSFKYSFVLPENIDANHAQAKCRGGMLTIRLEKRKTRHSVIKIQGTERSHASALRIKPMWETIKDKLTVLRVARIPHIKTS